MQSTMQHSALTILALFEHGQRIYPDSEVVTFDGATIRRTSFAEVARRVRQLAAALVRLGVKPGERVGTFCWNCQEHLEAYFAVPCLGAVLHTLNIRLFPEQIAYVINHAEDSVLIVDATLLHILEPLLPRLSTVRRLLIIGDAAPSLPIGWTRYEEALVRENSDMTFGAIDECSASAMCYTSGTTGNPKGVVYSHRSVWLHSQAIVSASCFGLTDRDRALVSPSMFHANAWGIPHAGWFVGADLILPSRYLQAEPLSRLIALERPTFAGAVPTIWSDLVRFAETHPVDLSSFRLVISGGSAVPRSLIEKLQHRHGVRLVQIWGLTETGPLAALAHPPAGTPVEDDIDWRTKTGRVLQGVELRLADGETILPWDGKAVGEIEVRGPWVTGAYYKDPTPDKFHDGWLRTGDIGTVDPLGYIQITDRSKDVIKSGGEWVSSVEIENHLMAHPDVIEAAVIAVPDARWDERPLACVVFKAGTATDFAALRAFLAERVVRWWLPERWAVIDEVPKTSVGKFDKKVLRERYANGELAVES
ncbi:MAG: fatty acid--CoA ligase [Gemmataceae bacterium]|nr:fatty acid--CoA ligase [Gemmataceae bacterium]